MSSPRGRHRYPPKPRPRLVNRGAVDDVLLSSSLSTRFSVLEVLTHCHLVSCSFPRQEQKCSLSSLIRNSVSAHYLSTSSGMSETKVFPCMCCRVGFR